MSFVVTLGGFRPGERYDGVKWTQVRIQEAASSAGPWTVLETFAIADYPDPTNPPTLSVTTDLAVLESGYYRLVFLDPAGNEQRSGHVFSSNSDGASAWGLVYATPSNLRAYLNVTATELNDAAAQRVLLQAEKDVDRVCGPPSDSAAMRVFIPTDLTVTERSSLVDATCAQAEYRLARGEQFFIAHASGESRYGPKMREELSRGGLRQLVLSTGDSRTAWQDPRAR